MRCARHRGPDEAGTWHDDDVVFGFNRLSIIDIEHSHQPLRWGPPESAGPLRAGVQRRDLQLPGAAGRAAHRVSARVFATEGDGEAIVAAYHYWGAAAVSRLRGMFAFLIWDTQDRRAVRRPRPVRHQAAVRRARLADGVAFSSEAKGLRETRPGHGDASDVTRRCSTTWCCSTCRSRPPWTAGSGEIESGTHVHRATRAATASTNATSSRCSPPADAISDADRSGAVRADRRRAGRFGRPSTCAPTSRSASFLSGGIDSTAIAALAKRYNPDLMTFTTGFEREGYLRGRRGRRVRRRDRGPARDQDGVRGGADRRPCR